MKSDITTRRDIEILVNKFYDKVKTDAIIGFFFTETILVDWETHLPKMYDFWENIVFATGHYNGNPMTIHQNINSKSAITKEHFTHWLKLFITTVDELYEGNKAELIKERAIGIATIMQIKLVYPQ
jgi:hemoglobin